MTKKKRDLIQILVTLKDETHMRDFLEDILTPAEFDDIATRLQLVRELKKGTPQRSIAKKLGISISKITRGSRTLQNNGFQHIS